MEWRVGMLVRTKQGIGRIKEYDPKLDLFWVWFENGARNKWYNRHSMRRPYV